jgi:hypothetical protein
MRDNEKLRLVQEQLKKQKDESLLSQKTKKEKLNIFKLTAVGLFEHFVGFILMICVLVVAIFLIYIAFEILIMLKTKYLHWRRLNWDGKDLSNWLWVLVGATTPGFIQGVSFFQGKLTNKNYKDKPVKFGLVPLFFGSLIFPGLFALTCISLINPTLFHLDGLFKIIGTICFGVVIGAILWFLVIKEKLKIRSSRSWW